MSQPKATLYEIEADLAQLTEILCELQAIEESKPPESLEEAEDTDFSRAELEHELTLIQDRYREAISTARRKRDAVAHFLRHMAAQEELARAEAARVARRARGFSRACQQMKDLCLDIIFGMPLEVDRKGGQKYQRLVGETSTLYAHRNSMKAVKINNPDLVPDDCRKATITMPLDLWLEIMSGADAQHLWDRLQKEANLDSEIHEPTIRRIITEGGKVAGAELKDAYHLRIL